MSDLANKALEIAIQRIGMKEDPIGSNWGVDVQGMLVRVGITTPAPWCMAFVYTCFDDAAQILGQPTPMIRTGKVMDAWRRTPGQYKFVRTISFQPRPGDVFIMDLGGDLGHCGIVEASPKLPDIHTIDGNTNADGGREGYEVERKLRHNARPIIGYFRF